MAIWVSCSSEHYQTSATRAHEEISEGDNASDIEIASHLCSKAWSIFLLLCTLPRKTCCYILFRMWQREIILN